LLKRLRREREWEKREREKKKIKCLKGATGNFHMFIVANFSKLFILKHLLEG
jgi:hypothetical protein